VTANIYIWGAYKKQSSITSVELKAVAKVSPILRARLVGGAGAVVDTAIDGGGARTSSVDDVPYVASMAL